LDIHAKLIYVHRQKIYHHCVEADKIGRT